MISTTQVVIIFEKMKELARAGWGLNTYIESEVKNDFSSKVF